MDDHVQSCCSSSNLPASAHEQPSHLYPDVWRLARRSPPSSLLSDCTGGAVAVSPDDRQSAGFCASARAPRGCRPVGWGVASSSGRSCSVCMCVREMATPAALDLGGIRWLQARQVRPLSWYLSASGFCSLSATSGIASGGGPTRNAWAT